MPTPVRHLIAMLACAAAALVGLPLAAGPAGAATAVAVPKVARHFTASIEDFAPYAGQTSCDPHIKAGTAALVNLLATTYPGTASASTYACGTDGSQSEHYEGRAIDWMVSARDATTWSKARAFRHWLLAPDSYGQPAAMARRLGVMYLIFNNRMWGAWDGRWHDYNGCLSARLSSRAYDNACHRTHMHISLSWNGAHGRTTFWTGRVSATDFGPCRRPGQRYAPRWTHVNLVGCP